MTLETVWVVQVLGLLFSLPLVLGLVGVAHRLRPHLWPYLYLVFLYCASSLQTWRGLFQAQWLSVLVLILMMASILFGIPHLWRHLQVEYQQKIKPDFSGLDLFSKSAFFLLVAALFIDLFFAAFPGYRYDQYNYHLVTPKLVDVYGTLPSLVGTDTTHFTGTWEFFFTSFRAVLNHDLLVQTATTTFTFLSYLVPISGFIWQLAKPQRFLSLWWVGIPALAIYIHVELEPVISAKPDFINVAAAMAIVAAQALTLRERFFFTFFFLAAGLALKVTWIHAALALSVGLVFAMARELRLKNLPFAITGALVGAFCVLPFLVKNTLLFGNPIHPTQAGPFQSNTLTPAFFEYWNMVSGAPKGISAVLKNILKVPWQHIHYYSPFLPVLIVAGYHFLRARSSTRGSLTAALPWIVSWGVFLLVWGVLFRFDIYNRFVAVGCIFPLILAAKWLGFILNPRVLGIVLVLPFAINGAVEVKLKRMVNGATQTYSQYSVENFSPGIQDWREAKVIQEHGQKMFGSEWSAFCNILSSKPNHYYFNTRFINFDDYAYDFQVSRFGRERMTACPWAFFRSQKICYLTATHEMEFQQWPEYLQPLISTAKTEFAEISDSDLRLRFISPAEMEKIMDVTPGCQSENVGGKDTSPANLIERFQ